MEILNSKVLVLGGWGLVGMAICRRLLERKPQTLIVSSLTRQQAEEAVRELRPSAGSTQLIPVWGNIFVRDEFKDLTRDEILNSSQRRLMLAEDILERTTATSFHKFFLHQLITHHRPDLIVDCVNTATGVAYQDIYAAGLRVLEGVKRARQEGASEEFLDEVEKLLGTLYIPQLIRHIQVIHNAMAEVGVKSYIKVGTTGTGGMGLNIPYTHSEDRPSRVLLSKSSIAGAHTLLLFLMARTPGGPYVKEVKPATAIAWKRIAKERVIRGGRPVEMFDCPPEKGQLLEGEIAAYDPHHSIPLNRQLEGVFIDSGENGYFSLGEFTAITSVGQMEYITPEEIADAVLWEIEGGNSGNDIIGALDAAILKPTYRAGVMRSLALQKMKAMGAEEGPPAYELLGPPRISKLLCEASLLRKVAVSINGILGETPQSLSQKIYQLISVDSELRSQIISVGIPILLPDGKHLLRGPEIKVPSDPRHKTFPLTPESLEKWAFQGWVDLREQNMAQWQERLSRLLQEAEESNGGDTSSRILRNTDFWKPDQPLEVGEIVGWILGSEDKGWRLK